MVVNLEAVTIFNGRTEKETRRKEFLPTVIRNVSYVEGKGSTVANNGVWSEDVQYKIRIPMMAEVQEDRAYVPGPDYAGMDDREATGHWTIQRGDMIMLGEYAGGSSLLYEDELAAYAKAQGSDLIRVTEYADNTFGGSRYLKHWRIGGQ